MEISEHDLGRLVAEVDDQHRAGMQSFVADPDELVAQLRDAAPSAGASRRRFLGRAALGGLVITAGSAIVPVGALISPAAAADAKPTDADLVTFSESIELGLVQAYGIAANLPTVTSPAVRNAFITFAGHHHSHALALSSLSARLGGKNSHQPNPLLVQVADGQFNAARSQNDVLDVGVLLEVGAASTYLVELATLTQLEAQQLSASILPVESQHATTFGQARGSALADIIPTFITTDRGFDPAKYPTA